MPSKPEDCRRFKHCFLFEILEIIIAFGFLGVVGGLTQGISRSGIPNLTFSIVAGCVHFLPCVELLSGSSSENIRVRAAVLCREELESRGLVPVEGWSTLAGSGRDVWSWHATLCRSCLLTSCIKMFH